MNKPIKILSIETSCDETAAAVLEVELNGKKFPKLKTLSAVVKSQIKLHAKMGGVVPETAARAHVKNILPVTEAALRAAFGECQGLPLTGSVDYLAVTQGPGLIPSLIVGVEFAKALSLATGIPVIPVNHMLGHLYSPFEQGHPTGAPCPMIALIVSGGHTMLVLMKNLYDYKILGETVDDAVGEAFDKVAKLLKLPYPGGPEVSKLAAAGNPNFEFPRPMVNSKDYNFSFAGLKTAVLYFLRDHPHTKPEDICRAFEDATVDVLITKTLKAAKQFKAKSISLSGGVSANKKLRETLTQKCEELNLKCYIPQRHLSTDNAEMIGMAAAVMLSNGYKHRPSSKIHADPNLTL